MRTDYVPKKTPALQMACSFIEKNYKVISILKDILQDL
jgi:hypothetical protein